MVFRFYFSKILFKLLTKLKFRLISIDVTLFSYFSQAFIFGIHANPISKQLADTLTANIYNVENKSHLVRLTAILMTHEEPLNHSDLVNILDEAYNAYKEVPDSERLEILGKLAHNFYGHFKAGIILNADDEMSEFDADWIARNALSPLNVPKLKNRPRNISKLRSFLWGEDIPLNKKDMTYLVDAFGHFNKRVKIAKRSIRDSISDHFFQVLCESLP